MTDKVSKASLIAVRPGEFSDTPFIYSTWLKGLRYGNDWYKQLDQDSYFKGQHKVIENILQDPKTRIAVACLVDAPEVIAGYSVSTGDTLHWVCVKGDWRGIGLARDLVPKNITTVSHITKAGQGILKKHPKVIFNPYAI